MIKVFLTLGKAPNPRIHRRCSPAGAALTVSLCALLCGVTLARTQGPSANEKFRLATEAMRAGHLDEAGKGFEAVIASSPSFAEAHFNLGLVREEQGRNDEAVACFQKALALKPRLHGGNLFLGVAEYRLNQLDHAL